MNRRTKQFCNLHILFEWSIGDEEFMPIDLDSFEVLDRSTYPTCFFHDFVEKTKYHNRYSCQIDYLNTTSNWIDPE